MTRSQFIKSRLIAGLPSLPWALILGLAFTAVPTGIRVAADPVISGTAYVTYYPFVLVAVLFIGWQGAAALTAAAAVLANFLFLHPRYVLFAGVDDTLATMFFIVASGLIIAVVDTLRRTVIDLEKATHREASLNAELRTLNDELQHRVKNSLSVVQALALHTFRGLPASDEAVRKFQGRLQALAQAQAVLTSGRWEHCRLPDLATRALAPFNGHGAVHCEGPSCSLPERACVPLVLALHELGTNALKYGSLSSLDGSVSVSWRVCPVEGDADVQQLVLDWIESGGPLVEIPTRRGLGSKLVARQTGIDSATLDFRPEGVVCRLVVTGAVLHRYDD